MHHRCYLQRRQHAAASDEGRCPFVASRQQLKLPSFTTTVSYYRLQRPAGDESHPAEISQKRARAPLPTLHGAGTGPSQRHCCFEHAKV